MSEISVCYGLYRDVPLEFHALKSGLLDGDWIMGTLADLLLGGGTGSEEAGCWGVT